MSLELHQISKGLPAIHLRTTQPCNNDGLVNVMTSKATEGGTLNDRLIRDSNLTAKYNIACS